ncbi:cysteine-rich KTR domain-containing protein [Halocella sp. SP3-1]|uniref:cysteine-rich KTR domain-containing protein n=1 Tax=Halocella sp. SP3-1 TaxID=2382161 RepID=UPI000F760E60|nr:cysteine-rich KTR domain-containing protein [Halocella sp. SP3-1]AZO96694.1 hypothetical protein D7D81_09335 [Halocella sp. SP3-1]
MKDEKWILCPICKSKTRLKIRQDTVLENFPLYCPKCKQETLINSRDKGTGTLSLSQLSVMGSHGGILE